MTRRRMHIPAASYSAPTRRVRKRLPRIIRNPTDRIAEARINGRAGGVEEPHRRPC